MDQYPYSFEPYKSMASKFHCPSCNHSRKTFTRYINNQTGEHIHSTVGKCDRVNSCGYYYTPTQYFKENNISNDKTLIQNYSKPKPIQPNPTSYINPDTFKASLKNYGSNNFIYFLSKKFGDPITEELISKYYIGTSKKWSGATVFWQVDNFGNVRSGKIMLYSQITGKRIKEPFNHIAWVHKVLPQPDFVLKQCIFGEHLLKGNSNQVAIVESEKTAIIASIYFPQLTWLAVGSLTNLTEKICTVLKGRSVILFPDLKAYNIWCLKADELSHITNFHVSSILEKNATPEAKLQGLDLADYLLKYSPNDFSNPHPSATTIQQPQIIIPKTIHQAYTKPSIIIPPDNRAQYLAAIENKYNNPS